MNLHDAATVPSGEYHGYPIVEGILKDEAVRLLRSFYDRENFHAPDDKRKRKPPPTEEDVDTFTSISTSTTMGESQKKKESG